MAIFQNYTLTRSGTSLLAKVHAGEANINFTKAVTGSGTWKEDEDRENATELKIPKQEFTFSNIYIPSGSTNTCVLEVIINNENLDELYYISEMGIFAKDPNGGEDILYAILTSPNSTIYVPANNTVGVSTIIERVVLEVAESDNITVNTDGAYVSASDFIEWRNILESIADSMREGSDGQILVKKSADKYVCEWKDMRKDVVTSPYADFPKTGEVNTLYVDSDSASIYVWNTTDKTYFKLPLGADAAETLQEQITALKKDVDAMKSTAINLNVPVGNWEETETSDGVPMYTQSIAVSGVKDTSDLAVWPRLISSEDSGSSVVEEKRAVGVFFSMGICKSESNSIVLKCYKRKPEVTFGIRVVGVL